MVHQRKVREQCRSTKKNKAKDFGKILNDNKKNATIRYDTEISTGKRLPRPSSCNDSAVQLQIVHNHTPEHVVALLERNFELANDWLGQEWKHLEDEKQHKYLEYRTTETLNTQSVNQPVEQWIHQSINQLIN